MAQSGTVTYESCSPIISDANDVTINCTIQNKRAGIVALAQVLKVGLSKAWIDQEFGTHSEIGVCDAAIYRDGGIKIEIAFKDGRVVGYEISLEVNGLPADRLSRSIRLDGFGFTGFPGLTVDEVLNLYQDKFEVPCSAWADHGNASGAVSLTCSTSGLTGAAWRPVHESIPSLIIFSWMFIFPSDTFDNLDDNAQSNITTSFWDFQNEGTDDSWDENQEYISEFSRTLGQLPINRIVVNGLWNGC